MSLVSTKASSPESVIQNFLFLFPVSSMTLRKREHRKMETYIRKKLYESFRRKFRKRFAGGSVPPTSSTSDS
jgi:hypothetical protein